NGTAVNVPIPAGSILLQTFDGIGLYQSVGNGYVDDLHIAALPLTAVVTAGPGCPNGSAPLLSSTSPVLGQTVTLGIAGAVPNATGALFASMVPAAPFSIGTGCTAYLDLPSVFEVSSVLTYPS